MLTNDEVGYVLKRFVGGLLKNRFNLALEGLFCVLPTAFFPLGLILILSFAVLLQRSAVSLASLGQL